MAAGAERWATLLHWLRERESDDFFTQYWVFDPSVNALGLVLTNGVEFRIGD